MFTCWSSPSGLLSDRAESNNSVQSSNVLKKKEGKSREEKRGGNEKGRERERERGK